jgi:radical SAM-linked protein
MRDVVNKGLTNEELLRGITSAVEQGWDKVKLYFMIGLPGETDLDVIGIAETVRWLRKECYKIRNKRLDFTLTISNFTPKPHTPFQWHSVSTAEFIRKQELLRNEFRGMKGVKVNYTDVRISAMEDFLGRGDRRLAPVIKRAWELGAGMDAWWESLNNAFAAWGKAIDESGLSWKYRQIEQGSWNISSVISHQSSVISEEEGNRQQATGNNFNQSSVTEEIESKKDPIPHSPFPIHQKLITDNCLLITDSPLPWDHINSGIDKNWLKEDLKRALEAATIPDCAFDGCSHCGVCGTDFGHNIVYQPPEIPKFEGEFKPDQERVQRFRVWFGKIGEMRLVSHLDLVRLFDRIVRRAALPIAFTNGFHPGPRISIANALSLGATSSGEIIDFELRKSMNIADFKQKLIASLPSDIPIYKVEEVDVKSLAATRLLEKAEYFITVKTVVSVDENTWQDWINLVKNTSEIILTKATKSNKIKQINLSELLFDLALAEFVDNYTVKLRFIGSCKNDGTLLHADQVIYMLKDVINLDFDLIHVHRERLILMDNM